MNSQEIQCSRAFSCLSKLASLLAPLCNCIIPLYTDPRHSFCLTEQWFHIWSFWFLPSDVKLKLCWDDWNQKLILRGMQRAKKVVSDSPGPVDFAIGLVFFVLNLPHGQVLFFGEIQITEGFLSILPIKKGLGASWNDLWASTCYLQLARMAGCKTDFLSTLGMSY